MEARGLDIAKEIATGEASDSFTRLGPRGVATSMAIVALANYGVQRLNGVGHKNVNYKSIATSAFVNFLA